MAGSTFQTNPFALKKLLDDCHGGELQLPDFQRSWVWDEDRIKSLIASISRAFPIGALMALETGGPVNFKPRPVEGAPDTAKKKSPRWLLLDGQQRMTSLYQVALRGQVVDTITPKRKKVRRWFYIDIRKAMDPNCDREDAVIAVPEDKVVKSAFGKEILLDLSTPDKEYAALMYPVNEAFDWDEWRDGFEDYWQGEPAVRKEFKDFKNDVLKNFDDYHVPVITLDRTTSKEAVCTVFEKVNTGGKALDAFELVTAMYAASGHELRKDWYGSDSVPGRHRLFKEVLRPAGQDEGIIAAVANTDFLQVISLFHTRDRRLAAEAAGKQGKELPAVTGNRKALLSLPLEAYKKHEKQAEQGFFLAAKFLNLMHVYRIFDLPYQSQIVPLAAILADIGSAWEHEANRAKLSRWYWNGVFGELYSSAVDTQTAKDFMEVTGWLKGGPEPTTITETVFRADRLKTMRMRLSAAYKGMNALLMKEGVRDFRSGQPFNQTVFFGENVDVHHIFPKDWCKKNKKGVQGGVFDSIINKTPLSYKTNRIIGGEAPSLYIERLEKGDGKSPPIDPAALDEYLSSHFLDPRLLRKDDFEGFMTDRQKRLLALIETALGKPAYAGTGTDDDEDAEVDDDAQEAQLTASAH